MTIQASTTRKGAGRTTPRSPGEEAERTAIRFPKAGANGNGHTARPRVPRRAISAPECLNEAHAYAVPSSFSRGLRVALPGGADWLLMRPDGAGELDVRATIKTDDGELVYIYYRGILDGPPDLIPRAMEGEEVDPASYYFRSAPVFETASEKYAWLNKVISVGVGSIHQAEVRYKVYAIL